MPKNLKYRDCIINNIKSEKNYAAPINPITKLIGKIEDIKWKSIYKGFKEYNLPIHDKDKIKLIKIIK